MRREIFRKFFVQSMWFAVTWIAVQASVFSQEPSNKPPPNHAPPANSHGDVFDPYKSPQVGFYSEYAVAADHPEASKAGAEILAEGGTAADAAVAVMLALGVVNPFSSGLGGGGFALYFDAKKNQTVFVDFRERAPLASTPDMFERAEKEMDTKNPGFRKEPLMLPSQYGGLASGVPGEAAGMDLLLKKFGKLKRKKIVDPALRLAKKGVHVTEKHVWLSDRFGSQMIKDSVMKKWFKKGKTSWEEGDVFKQPTLAKTLSAFSKKGAKAIYSGKIAKAIVKANQKFGGIFTLKDLAEYKAVERPALMGEAFGYLWVTAPPPSAGGFTMLQSLAFLKRLPRLWLNGESNFLHALAESWKGPFLDRRHYFGDPDFVKLPLEQLLNAERVQGRVDHFNLLIARETEVYNSPLSNVPVSEAKQSEGGGTSHFCVVDAEGNVASVTTTVNLPFGARYTAAGMLMNDEMDDFARGVNKKNAFDLPGGEANLPGPGKRPVSTMSPTIIFENGKPVMCVGGAGGSKIVTATEQVALRQLVQRRGPWLSMITPRIHHQGVPELLRTEETHPMPAPYVEQLESRLHEHRKTHHVAAVQLIRIFNGRTPGVGKTRKMVAVCDPRKGGKPAGK